MKVYQYFCPLGDIDGEDNVYLTYDKCLESLINVLKDEDWVHEMYVDESSCENNPLPYMDWLTKKCKENEDFWINEITVIE